jgi:SAM-dependent methyltransferase
VGGSSLRLNLGSADDLRREYVNVDVFPQLRKPGCEFQQADLSQPWPWPANSVDEIFARDIVEHLPDKRHTMNEAWRVLRNGGRFEIIVPTTDGRGAFQDPTHVSFWTPNDLTYYTVDGFERQRLGAAYGIAAKFRVVNQKHEELAGKVWKMTVTLEAVKP